MRLKVTNRVAEVRRDMERRKARGMYNLGKFVLQGAGNRTPKKTGRLRRQTQVRNTGQGEVTVKWGARYAAVQDQGMRRGAKPFKRYTTSGTGKGFVKLGVDTARQRVREAFTR